MPEEHEREFLKHKSWTEYLEAFSPVIILLCIAAGYFYLAAVTPIELGSATGEIVGFRMHSGLVSPWYTAIVRLDNVTSLPENHEFENPAEVFIGICGVEEFKYFKCGLGSGVAVKYQQTWLMGEYWEIYELLG